MDDSKVNDTADAPRAEPTEGVRSVEELRREVEEKQDRLLRALAETENVRRRAQRERDDYVRYANESLLRDLIPVLDNLDRALEAARPGGDATGVVAGVERYSALGQPFDPTRHEAIASVVSEDTAPGTVVRETLPGYQLHNRVLRAALVSVAAAPDESA